MSPRTGTSKSSSSTLTTRASWLVPGLVGGVALALTAARAPARMKLLALFAVGLGLLTGAGLGWLAELAGERRRRLLIALAGVLGAAVFTGATLEAHRVWSAAQRERIREAAFEEERLPLPIPEAEGEAAPAIGSDAFETLVEELTGFPAYATARVRQLGDWPAPAAIAFWGAEVALAGIAAALAAGWTRHGKPPALDASRESD